ncbi:flagellar basal body P-ring formation chaperone FlgA [Chitinimonas sp.]|uniref:flagellar basal body P-ring formation chaperone FlgA n=1 Tax=Chitinimonas sp. TaxID=1934313 RepID=UPI0035B14ED3
MSRTVFLPALVAVSLLANSADRYQDAGAIAEAASRFIGEQLANYGSRASFQLGKLDSRLNLAPCAKIDVVLPAGNRLIGNTSVQIKCGKGAKWAVNLPVAISIQTDYWVAARPLINGSEISESDIEKRSGDLGQLPANAVLDYAQAVGHTLVGGIPAGAPLRLDLLRPPFAVKINEVVKVLAHGTGFEVASEGRALGNANEGQAVRVKMASGAIVQGTAREGGLVEIKY